MNFCENDCEFCNEFLGEQSRYDRTIKKFDDNYVLLTTIGCFREGYTLLLPVKHVMSYANLGKKELDSLAYNIELIRSAIQEEYSCPVILAEHGSGYHDLGASCCEHAHLHLIPVDHPNTILNYYQSVGGKATVFNDLSNIHTFSGVSYIYLSLSPKKHYVWSMNTNFSRQFVRKVCANIDGVGNNYNWRFFPFEENMSKTTIRLRKAIKHIAFQEKTNRIVTK